MLIRLFGYDAGLVRDAENALRHAADDRGKEWRFLGVLKCWK